MTNQEFFDKIENFRIQSSKLLAGNGGFNITRGMAHTISGYVEDLFALFIAEKLNRRDLTFYVDKVISTRYNEGDKAKSFKPDLSIIDNQVMTYYFDVKTNMGWNRNFGNYLQEKDNFISNLQGQDAWINNFRKEKSYEYIKIADNLKYQMVVVYGWNINQELLKRNLEDSSKFSNIKVCVLCNYVGNEFRINQPAFESIFKTLGV
jgi:hypothetical protein